MIELIVQNPLDQLNNGYQGFTLPLDLHPAIRMSGRHME